MGEGRVVDMYFLLYFSLLRIFSNIVLYLAVITIPFSLPHRTPELDYNKLITASNGVGMVLEKK
jgi:hypothetical protein